MTPSEAFEWIHQFLKEIDTQDTRATAQPIQFLLQRKDKYVSKEGYNYQTISVFTHPDSDIDEFETYQEAVDWVRSEYAEAEEQAAQIENIDEFQIGHCWKTDQAFFTEKGYERHLAQNRHNLGPAEDRRTYVVHAFRNPEMVELFKALRAIDAMGNKIKYTEISQELL